MHYGFEGQCRTAPVQVRSRAAGARLVVETIRQTISGSNFKGQIMLRSVFSSALVLALCGFSSMALAVRPEVKRCKEEPPANESAWILNGGDNLVVSPGTTANAREVEEGPPLASATSIINGGAPAAPSSTRPCEILEAHPALPSTGEYVPSFFEWRVADPGVAFETAVAVWSHLLPELPPRVSRIEIAEWKFAAAEQGPMRAHLRIGLQGTPGWPVSVITAEYRHASGLVELRYRDLRSTPPGTAVDTTAMVAWIPDEGVLKVAVGGQIIMTVDTDGYFPVLVRKGLIEAAVSGLVSPGTPADVEIQLGIVHGLVTQ